VFGGPKGLSQKQLADIGLFLAESKGKK